MNPQDLINKRVLNKQNRMQGIIKSVNGTTITVDNGPFGRVYYPYPSAFSDILILEDDDLQEQLKSVSTTASFGKFKQIYRRAIEKEIDYVRSTGGKKYRIIDGVRIQEKNGVYLYSFETDAELHFTDGTPIKLWFPTQIVPGQIVACEDFTLMITTYDDLGAKIETVQFTAESWHLMEALMDRLDELDEILSPIAYEIACKGKSQIDYRRPIRLSQNIAISRSAVEPITFIWGPPGTGKTTTLAKIALDAMHHGERVLMLSYSNVSVDGALLRVASMSDDTEGQIVRYGYPRLPELVDSRTLTSYAYVIQKNEEIAKKYYDLIDQRKKLRRNDPRRTEINKAIDRIRALFKEKEQELISTCPFVATTVSKAVVDKAIFSQKFDLVIFDEASMAYVPQIIFSAGLAEKRFCCLGDFRQLPAIVQDKDNTVLKRDIFDYVDITSAVENGNSHNWLVMLDTQYRMHPSIAEFVGAHMYEGILKSSDLIFESKQAVADSAPNEKLPMSMIDLSGSYSVCIRTNDGSHINLMSAMICMRLAEMLIDQHEIGIITPYSAQSRLILAMIRDLQERDNKYRGLTTATVHQFQGSEKPVIIYDAVDCYRMLYPGTLLTSKENDTANRLFNVALTRTQGKFILVANMDFMMNKGLSKNLLFYKMMQHLKTGEAVVRGMDIYNEIASEEDSMDEMFLGERDEEDSWNRYLNDIANAEHSIYIEIPGVLDEDEDALEQMADEIEMAVERDVKIFVKLAENITVPEWLEPYTYKYNYVTTPITVIDEQVIWFGEPLSSADFLSGGNPILTEHFPCLRFVGKHTARLLRAVFEIPNMNKGDVRHGKIGKETDPGGAGDT